MEGSREEKNAEVKRFEGNCSFNWLTDKCGYFFLMSTKSSERLAKYIENIKMELESFESSMQSLQEHQSYFKLTINKLNYFIENTWLNDHIKSQSPHLIDQTQLDADIIQDPTVDLKQPETTTQKQQTTNNEHDHLEAPKPDQDENSKIPADGTTLSAGEEANGVGSEIVIADEMDKDPIPLVILTPLIEPDLSTEPTATTTPPPTAPVVFTPEETTPPTPLETTTITSTVTTPTKSPPPVVAPTKESVLFYGKEAVFIRLSNRIKILELNMSLSSQYLEKLSQHYRIQMDDMETTFNFTTNALKEATRVSDERDMKQNARIVELEKRLLEMRGMINLVNVDMGNLRLQTNVLSFAFVLLLGLTFFRKIFSESKLTQKQIEFIIEKKLIQKITAKEASKDNTDHNYSDLNNSSEQFEEITTNGTTDTIGQRNYG